MNLVWRVFSSEVGRGGVGKRDRGFGVFIGGFSSDIRLCCSDCSVVIVWIYSEFWEICMDFILIWLLLIVVVILIVLVVVCFDLIVVCWCEFFIGILKFGEFLLLKMVVYDLLDEI